MRIQTHSLHAEVVLLYRDFQLAIAESAALLLQLFLTHLKKADLRQHNVLTETQQRRSLLVKSLLVNTSKQ